MAFFELGGFVSGLLNFMVVALFVLIVGTVVIVAFITLRNRRLWVYDVVYLNMDGITGGKDLGAVYVDKQTNMKMFFLKNLKAGLNPNNIPWKLVGNRKVVYLIRTGQKTFRYINWKFNADTLITEVGEEDVNTAIQDFEKQKFYLGKQSMAHMLAFGAFIVISLVIMVMIIFVLNKFDTLLDLGEALKETAQILREMKSGTTVIPSGA